MTWTGISGSRTANAKIEHDVRAEVSKLMAAGNGLTTGGALGVDSIALDEALKTDKAAKRIKIFIPAPLPIYAAHYRKRAAEGKITNTEAENLISQLERLQRINRDALIETLKNKEVNSETYFERNGFIVDSADELTAFQVNESPGTQNTIDKAKNKGIPVRIFKYII